MNHEIKLTIVVFLIMNFLQLSVCKKKTKYGLNYDSKVDVCDDDDSRSFIATENIKSVRYNASTGMLDGTFEFKKKLDGLIKISFVVEKILASGRELVTTHEVVDFCKQVKGRFIKSIYSPYLSVINFPEECPVEPGTYTIDNMVADSSAFPINFMKEGPYMVTISFTQNEIASDSSASNVDVKLGCITLRMKIEPEE